MTHLGAAYTTLEAAGRWWPPDTDTLPTLPRNIDSVSIPP